MYTWHLFQEFVTLPVFPPQPSLTAAFLFVSPLLFLGSINLRFLHPSTWLRKTKRPSFSVRCPPGLRLHFYAGSSSGFSRRSIELPAQPPRRAGEMQGLCLSWFFVLLVGLWSSCGDYRGKPCWALGHQGRGSVPTQRCCQNHWKTWTVCAMPWWWRMPCPMKRYRGFFARSEDLVRCKP